MAIYSSTYLCILFPSSSLARHRHEYLNHISEFIHSETITRIYTHSILHCPLQIDCRVKRGREINISDFWHCCGQRKKGSASCVGRENIKARQGLNNSCERHFIDVIQYFMITHSQGNRIWAMKEFHFQLIGFHERLICVGFSIYIVT